jgi:hypothetical protein
LHISASLEFDCQSCAISSSTGYDKMSFFSGLVRAID